MLTPGCTVVLALKKCSPTHGAAVAKASSRHVSFMCISGNTRTLGGQAWGSSAVAVCFLGVCLFNASNYGALHHILGAQR